MKLVTLVVVFVLGLYGQTKITSDQMGRIKFDQLMRLAKSNQTRPVVQILDPTWFEICAEPLSTATCIPSGLQINAPIMIWSVPNESPINPQNN